MLNDNLCGTACCKDFDCPENSVCVQSGSGARVCLPIEIAGRQRAQAGERCSRSSDCASGVCQDRKCIATCSSDADCNGGEMCRLNVRRLELALRRGRVDLRRGRRARRDRRPVHDVRSHLVRVGAVLGLHLRGAVRLERRLRGRLRAASTSWCAACSAVAA